MTFVLGAGSLKELTGVHPRLVDVVQRAIKISPVDFGVHDGLRTEAEQREYVKRGVSQTMNSMHRKQADGLGHAVDLVPYINGKLRWEWDPIYDIAAAVAQALKDHNEQCDGQKPLVIRWGGCWELLHLLPPTSAAMEAAVQMYGARRRKEGKKAFTDGPHFEVPL